MFRLMSPVQFETIEFKFIDAVTAFTVSTSPIITEKWLFYPVYVKGKLVEMRVG